MVTEMKTTSCGLRIQKQPSGPVVADSHGTEECKLVVLLLSKLANANSVCTTESGQCLPRDEKAHCLEKGSGCSCTVIMELWRKLSTQGGAHILGPPCHCPASVARAAKSGQLSDKAAVCVPVNYTVGHQSAVSGSCLEYQMTARGTGRL